MSETDNSTQTETSNVEPQVAPQVASAPKQTGSDSSLANLRAELAAERVEKRRIAEEAASAKAALEAARTASDSKIQETLESEKAKYTKLQTRLADAVIREEAVKMGLLDPDLLLNSLFDRAKIVVDEDGTVTGAVEALEAFKGSKPEWFKLRAGGTPEFTTKTGSGVAPTPAVTGGSAASSVKSMNAAQYAEYKMNLLRSMRRGASH